MLGAVSQFGDALLELPDGGFPFVVIGLAIGEEFIEPGVSRAEQKGASGAA
jgi:hypothetical protein